MQIKKNINLRGREMLSKVKTCILQGLEGHIIDVEVDISRGLPQLSIVGLADMSIKEAKERVRSAITNSEFQFPLSRITINLAPANLKKEGSQIDLAIAVGILTATGIIEEMDIADTCVIGELSLDGNVNKINGALPIVISLRELGFKRVIIPKDNKDECSALDGIEIIPVGSLRETIAFLNNEIKIEPFKTNISDMFESEYEHDETFEDIKGQEGAKRAMEIAAAGGHNIIFIGPPGSGKTMISKRITSILPNLTFEESLEITKIYSISGLLEDNELVKKRPFRSPHHTISPVALVGGGRMPTPGEVSLSHFGVLFLDEFPEFSKSAIEILRQPMEDGVVTVSRLSATLTFPSRFLLVATMNPCKCGFHGDSLNACSCSQKSIDSYLSKISGPILDRIDLHTEVKPVKYKDLEMDNKNIETSKDIKKRVDKARKIQLKRYRGQTIYSNSELDNKHIDKHCKLDSKSKDLLEMAFNNLGLSARAYNKILKVARTIADLDGSEDIKDNHIAEAIQYRSLDRKYW